MTWILPGRMAARVEVSEVTLRKHRLYNYIGSLQSDDLPLEKGREFVQNLALRKGLLAYFLAYLLLHRRGKKEKGKHGACTPNARWSHELVTLVPARKGSFRSSSPPIQNNVDHTYMYSTSTVFGM